MTNPTLNLTGPVSLTSSDGERSAGLPHGPGPVIPTIPVGTAGGVSPAGCAPAYVMGTSMGAVNKTFLDARLARQ